MEDSRRKSLGELLGSCYITRPLPGKDYWITAEMEAKLCHLLMIIFLYTDVFNDDDSDNNI